MALFDDLTAALSPGPTLVAYGAAPDIGATHTTFHARLRSILLREPGRAEVIGPRIAQVYRGLFPNAPAAVPTDCALAHMRIALKRTDFGPPPLADCLREATPEPPGRRKQLVASARLVLDAERRHAAEVRLEDEARREVARRELQARYARDRLNVPRRPKGGWR